VTGRPERDLALLDERRCTLSAIDRICQYECLVVFTVEDEPDDVTPEEGTVLAKQVEHAR